MHRTARAVLRPQTQSVTAPRRRERFARAAKILGSLGAAAVLGISSSGTAVAAPDEITLPAVVDLGVTDVRDLLTSGTTTSYALTQAYIDRIEAYEGPYGTQFGINAIITMNPNALVQAQNLDAERAAGHVRGPLHGVPILIKDNYDFEGLPTSNGSVALKDFRPADSATQVQRLVDAGAIIVAKTNLHEYAHGITSISSLGGQTRNPYNQLRNPGGSSGGTGAGVASSFAAAGMGSDTCGSIRIPATQNNLTGLRPTVGLSSRDGIAPMSATQDVGGPIAKTVEDLALILDATVGYDPKDPITAESNGKIPDTYVSSLSDTALQGKRIALLIDDADVSPYFGVTDAERPTTDLIKAAAADLRAQGATVINLPFSDEIIDALSGTSVIVNELERDLNAYLAQAGATYPAELAALTQPASALTLTDIIESGLVYPSVMTSLINDHNQASAATAADDLAAKLAKRDLAISLITQFFEDNQLDALAYPTIRQIAEPVQNSQPGSNCSISATTGFPAISVQAGFTSTEGMPVGLELMGLPYSEPDLLGMAFDYSEATNHRRAPASVPELPSRTIPAPGAGDPSPTPTPTDPGQATGVPTATATATATLGASTGATPTAAPTTIAPSTSEPTAIPGGKNIAATGTTTSRRAITTALALTLLGATLVVAARRRRTSGGREQ
jgi:amidase